MNEWDAYSHLGFFDYIKNNLLDGPCEYKTLGCKFKSMHLLWFNYIDTTKYSITNGIIDEIYLQFENSIESSNENILAVKLRANPDALKDNNKKAMLNEFRSRLREFLEENLNLPSTSSFVKIKRKFGTTMTNDYVTYNLENYKDVMSSLQNTLDKFLLTL